LNSVLSAELRQRAVQGNNDGDNPRVANPSSVILMDLL